MRRERCRASSSPYATIPRRRSPRPQIDRFPLHRNVVVVASTHRLRRRRRRARVQSHTHTHLKRRNDSFASAAHCRRPRTRAPSQLLRTCVRVRGIRLTVHDSRKMGLDFRFQGAITRDRSIAIRSVCVLIHSMLDRSMEFRISTLIECGRDLIDGNDRSRDLIGGFCGSGFGFPSIDGGRESLAPIDSFIHE